MTVAWWKLRIPGTHHHADEVLQAMHRPALDIYSEEMLELTDSLLADLSKLFATKGKSYIYIANGHGAWEATLSNVLSRGDKLLVLESGRFAIGWGQAAAAMGVEVEVLKGDWRRAIRPAEVEARLKQDKDHRIKAIVAVQVDTASGAYNDIEEIGKAIKSTGHPALFMVDTVASLGCMPFEMDKWGIDVAMSGSQKGLMTPPGLGFVAANERAREVHKRRTCARPIGTGPSARAASITATYAGTAPVHLLFALRKAIDMLHVEGLENAFLRHRLLGEAVRRAVAVWGEGQVIGFNIAEANERSNTVTTVTMNGFDPAALQRYCKEKCGVVLGTGIGDLSGQAFRIAHMGHVNAPMIFWARSASSRSASMRLISRTARAEPKPRSNISARTWARKRGDRIFGRMGGASDTHHGSNDGYRFAPPILRDPYAAARGNGTQGDGVSHNVRSW